MANYKEENGTTRVGDFLRGIKDVAPEVLKAAGSLTGIQSLKDIGTLIKGDRVMSPHDKEMALKLLEMDIEEGKEVTKRWSDDMVSDSWLSKNVRPLTLLWLILFTSVIIIADSVEGWNFTVKAAWITLLSTLLVTVIVSYFGSRGIEKYQKIRTKK